MAAYRKYERDIDILLAEEFTVSPAFAAWFLAHTRFSDANAQVLDVYVSRSDSTGESDLVVVFEEIGGDSRFALLIEDKIDAPLQPEQEAPAIDCVPRPKCCAATTANARSFCARLLPIRPCDQGLHMDQLSPTRYADLPSTYLASLARSMRPASSVWHI